MPPLVPSSSTECPRESEPPERHRDSALPECPLEVVEFTKNFHGGSSPPLLTEAPDLPWPLKLPASVPETKCALSASCVSVSSRSRPGISAPPWRAPAPLWRPPVSSAPPWWASVSSAPPWWASVSSAPPWRASVSSAPPWWASVSSAPPWWASVSSAPPWWASVSSAPPWWAPDLPESPHVSVDLPESPHVSVDLPESPHVSVDLPESPHVTAVYPVSLHVPAVSSALPWWAPVSLAPHGPGPPFPPPVPPPLHRPPGLCRFCVKRLEAALRGGGSVMNLVATHSNCTSPMDYISHHALHSHIPVHHYTNHTAVTIHSLVLIVSPHLHLINSHTFKQHSHALTAKSCFPLVNILSVSPVF